MKIQQQICFRKDYLLVYQFIDALVQISRSCVLYLLALLLEGDGDLDGDLFLSLDGDRLHKN